MASISKLHRLMPVLMSAALLIPGKPARVLAFTPQAGALEALWTGSIRPAVRSE